MAMVNINGADFYYELHGSGQPLVLIAGYTCDHTYWLPVLDYLSKHYQILVFDNRAVGRTKDDGSPLSIELLADDVYALCRHFHLEKPHIVGQSMGGAIAQTFAANYSDNINKLVILTSAAKWRKAVEVAFRSLLLMRKQGIDFDLIFEASVPWIYGQEFLQNKRNLEIIKRVYLENPYPQSIEDQERQFNLINQFDGISQLAAIQAPTLVVGGIQDLISLPNDSQFLADNIKRADLLELDCAHGIVLEVPKLIAKSLHEFLN